MKEDEKAEAEFRSKLERCLTMMDAIEKDSNVGIVVNIPVFLCLYLDTLS